jgi:hypothetical protein
MNDVFCKIHFTTIPQDTKFSPMDRSIVTTELTHTSELLFCSTSNRRYIFAPAKNLYESLPSVQSSHLVFKSIQPESYNSSALHFEHSFNFDFERFHEIFSERYFDKLFNVSYYVMRVALHVVFSSNDSRFLPISNLEPQSFRNDAA